MATSLSQLLTPKTATDLKTRLIALLQAKGYPTIDWATGSIDRTLLEIFSEALSDQTSLIPAITEGGFNELADGLWLDLVAEQLYNQTRNAATFTVGKMTLAAATGAGPYTIAIGDLRAIFSLTGNIYINTTGGTLAAGPSTLELSWTSEAANNSSAGLNYTDGNNAAVSLQTSLAGVTITNPGPDFSPVVLGGNGTGTLTPSRIVGGTTPTPSSYIIRIDANGDIGVATFSYSKNGTAFVSGGFVPTTFDFTAENVRITFANGSGTPNSFLKDDRYSFVTPGSWITSQGTNTELDEALRAKNRGRWPSLSATPTEEAYATMARNASPSVIQVRVRASSTTPGGVDVIVAGQAGALSGSIVSDIQTYIDQRTSLTDHVLVQSASPLAVTIGGVVTVKAANLVQAQSEAQTNVANSIFNAGIGGTYFLAQVFEDIMRATGVIDFKTVTINGVAANLVFGTTQVGSFTQSLATGLTWISV